MVTQCPNCKAKFKARDELKGKVTKCPKCQQPFTVSEFVAGRKPAPRPAAVPAAVQSRTSAPVPQSKRAPTPQPAPQRAYESGGGEELSDTLYVYSVLCALVISVFCLFLGQMCTKESDRAFDIFGVVLMAIGAVFGIYSTIFMLLMYYKMWAAIQDGNARTGPGKAVGLLLVPVVNIFWAIYMFVGFAVDYEAYAARNSRRSENLSKGLMLQYALLWIYVTICFIVLYVLPPFGIGNRVFGGVYASFGSAQGLLRPVIIAWKLLNIPITVWLFALYAIVSTRICRAVGTT